MISAKDILVHNLQALWTGLLAYSILSDEEQDKTYHDYALYSEAVELTKKLVLGKSNIHEVDEWFKSAMERLK